VRPFLYLALLATVSSLGVLFPETFKNFKDYIVPLLVLIMLSMGLTLEPQDFQRILRRPHIILYGALLQFTLMPLTGYATATALRLKADLTAGFVLVGSAPGGTASNLITYLWKGSVPYSISMTALSTLLAPLLTPLWTLILVGKLVPVPFTAMAITTLKIVVFPVVAGMVIRRFLGPLTDRVESILPTVAVLSISFIIAVIFSLNLDSLKTADAVILLGVLIHNCFGFVLGYAFGRLAGLDHNLAKTLSVEVGMQNSGLSTVLALKFFSALAALPSAVFSLSQNIIGVGLSPLIARSKVNDEGG